MQNIGGAGPPISERVKEILSAPTNHGEIVPRLKHREPLGMDFQKRPNFNMKDKNWRRVKRVVLGLLYHLPSQKSPSAGACKRKNVSSQTCIRRTLVWDKTKRVFCQTIITRGIYNPKLLQNIGGAGPPISQRVKEILVRRPPMEKLCPD